MLATGGVLKAIALPLGSINIQSKYLGEKISITWLWVTLLSKLVSNLIRLLSQWNSRVSPGNHRERPVLQGGNDIQYVRC
jgi:hypothetical protein